MIDGPGVRCQVRGAGCCSAGASPVFRWRRPPCRRAGIRHPVPRAGTNVPVSMAFGQSSFGRRTRRAFPSFVVRTDEVCAQNGSLPDTHPRPVGAERQEPGDSSPERSRMRPNAPGCARTLADAPERSRMRPDAGEAPALHSSLHHSSFLHQPVLRLVHDDEDAGQGAGHAATSGRLPQTGSLTLPEILLP